jgi:hypothetical protein
MDIFIYASYALYHFCSSVIIHLSVMVYAFLFSILRYAQHIPSDFNAPAVYVQLCTLFSSALS